MEDSNIPPSSKVVTRVYINGSGKENNAKKRLSFKSNSHQYELLETFRVQFTEAMPLFDFVDVGHGKERADEKIRGIPQPSRLAHDVLADQSQKISIFCLLTLIAIASSLQSAPIMASPGCWSSTSITRQLTRR